MRHLSKADTARKQNHQGSQAQNGSHTLTFLQISDKGMLIFASLASSDKVELASENEDDDPLASSFEVRLAGCGNSDMEMSQTLSTSPHSNQRNPNTTPTSTLHHTTNLASLRPTHPILIPNPPIHRSPPCLIQTHPTPFSSAGARAVLRCLSSIEATGAASKLLKVDCPTRPCDWRSRC